MNSKETEKNSFSTQTIKYLERLFFDAHDQGYPIRWQDSPRVAMMHLCRPGWPGTLLTKEERVDLEKEMEHFAIPFQYMMNEQSIKRFSFKTVQALFNKIPKARFGRLRNKTLKQEAQEFIKIELHRTGDPKTSVLRAAQALRESQKYRVALDKRKDADVLREVINLPTLFNGQLDTTLVCAKMITAKKNVLASLLKKALPFSAHRLRESLGSDLYALAKPVGYADQQEKVLLIEVSTSAASHEVHFRKSEILQKLRSIEAFKKIIDFRIKMAS